MNKFHTESETKVVSVSFSFFNFTVSFVSGTAKLNDICNRSLAVLSTANGCIVWYKSALILFIHLPYYCLINFSH